MVQMMEPVRWKILEKKGRLAKAHRSIGATIIKVFHSGEKGLGQHPRLTEM